jgi:putative endonuclease
VNRGERLAARHYRLRGYRILGENVRTGGYELDLIVRRGRRLVFVEVKERASDAFGGGVGAVNREKRRRVRLAAASWLRAHPESGSRSASRSPRSGIEASRASRSPTTDFTAGMTGTPVPLECSRHEAGGHYPPTGAFVNTGRAAQPPDPGRVGPSGARWREKPPADRDRTTSAGKDRTVT